MGIIYVSHRLEEVLSVSDRITVLRDGTTVGTRLASESSTADVINLMLDATPRTYFRKSSDARESVVLKVTDVATATGLSGVSFDLHAGEISVSSACSVPTDRTRSSTLRCRPHSVRQHRNAGGS